MPEEEAKPVATLRISAWTVTGALQRCRQNRFCSLPAFRGREELGTVWLSGQRAWAGIRPLPRNLHFLSPPGAPSSPPPLLSTP